MRLVLFDLDGTLVDSLPRIHASIRVTAAALGLPGPAADQLTAVVGPPLQDGFASSFGLAAGDLDRAVEAYREHYSAGAILDAPVYPGIADLLSPLRADGTTLAVATSKPEQFARRILHHVGLADAFHSAHGATMDGRVRHKQQVVGLALAVHPDGEQPVLVGDPRAGRRRRPGARTALNRRRAGPGPPRRARAGRRGRRRGHPGRGARGAGGPLVPPLVAVTPLGDHPSGDCSVAAGKPMT